MVQSMAKILVIEDADSIRNMIVYALVQAGFDVSEASDGEMALKMATEDKYDLLLIDWMLPKVSGIEIVQSLRASKHTEIMLMLTAKDSDDDIVKAFELGVDDYLNKPISPRVLIARIKAHLKNSNNPIDSYSLGNTTVDYEKREVRIANELIECTCKEFALLSYLLEHKNTVVSRDNILKELWDFSYDGDTRIVDVHILKLRNKLKASDLSIETSRGIGYMLREYEDR